MGAVKLDGRAALISLIVFVFAVVSVSKYNVAGVIALSALPVFVIVMYEVKIRPILKKLLVISPFLLFAAGANVFIDKHPVVFADYITLRGGVVSATVIALKGYVTVMATLVLVELVSFDRLCRSMEKMKIPSVFVTQLSLLYRYFQLLKSEALTMARARDLRTFNG
ncbi:MAG: cobalt ABC transporter, partial [Fibrobacteres bacterium]|nr:cobalt ABC transporter [Fibrobacterota bacterium]